MEQAQALKGTPTDGALSINQAAASVACFAPVLAPSQKDAPPRYDAPLPWEAPFRGGNAPSTRAPIFACASNWSGVPWAKVAL